MRRSDLVIIISNIGEQSVTPRRKYSRRGRRTLVMLASATSWREDADIERNCTAPDYGPCRINTFLHNQVGIDARVPVPGLLRRYSGGQPDLSPKTCRR